MKIAFSNLLLLALCFYTSCDLDLPKEDEPKTELEKLPPITTTGENTFGCLVNGKAFVVRNTSNLVAIFQQGQLQLGASLDGNETDESISIALGDNLQDRQTYFFDGASFNSGYTLRNGNSVCVYNFSDTFLGSITLSKIDRITYIVSGTFEFSTVIQNCDTVRINDGRFDMQYIP